MQEETNKFGHHSDTIFVVQYKRKNGNKWHEDPVLGAPNLEEAKNFLNIFKCGGCSKSTSNHDHVRRIVKREWRKGPYTDEVVWKENE